jgi:hypothetical protein
MTARKLFPVLAFKYKDIISYAVESAGVAYVSLVAFILSNLLLLNNAVALYQPN